jgi:hypothetical protein
MEESAQFPVLHITKEEALQIVGGERIFKTIIQTKAKRQATTPEKFEGPIDHKMWDGIAIDLVYLAKEGTFSLQCYTSDTIKGWTVLHALRSCLALRRLIT